MNAEEFLQQVEKAMPERSILEEYGLEADEIADIQATFIAQRRSPSSTTARSEVERLVAEFDCSRLEIGLVRFSEELTAFADGRCFGACEADPLVVRPDGSIALYDHAQPASMLHVCANDAERFLDGLATFVRIRGEKSTWVGRVEEAAKAYAHSAGGSKYKDFFRSLCAFLDA